MTQTLPVSVWRRKRPRDKLLYERLFAVFRQVGLASASCAVSGLEGWYSVPALPAEISIN